MRLIAVAFINYFVGENTSQSFDSLVSGIVVIKIAVDVFECAERAEKKRGKCLFAKHLPRISLIFSIFRLFLDGCLCGG